MTKKVENNMHTLNEDLAAFRKFIDEMETNTKNFICEANINFNIKKICGP